ncbi:TIGR02186 family protein [Paracoccaceae bacterium GXU_MW_L88]
MIRLLLFLALALPAFAQPSRQTQSNIVVGLSQEDVSITTDFSGSQIYVFGAVRNIEGEGNLDVVVTVQGPSTPVIVRRKERNWGIWMNGQAVEVDQAPSFYAVAATEPIGDLLTNTDDLRYRISLKNAIRMIGAPLHVDDMRVFTDAVRDVRTRQGTYRELDTPVVLREQTLFDTAIDLPANLIEGDFTVRIFLLQNGRVIANHAEDLPVRKVGLERTLYNLANERPLLYGLLAIALALAAGWTASEVFRWIRR